MNVQLNDSGVPIIKQKTLAQKIKGILLWTILIILTIAAGLLVYLCIAGASEMAALTTVKKVSDHPYYTMTYENYDYSDLINSEAKDNGEVLDYFKTKFFKGLSGMMPGEYETDKVVRPSVAFYSRSYIATYFKGRMYNSYDTPIILITAKPQNGYKSWNIVDMADVGIQNVENIDQWYGNSFQTISAAYCVSEGINSEGLSVSLISCPVADCEDTAKINITPFLAVRLLLDRTATVDSAIDLLDTYDIDFSSGTYHFLISEKERYSAVVEYVGGKMSVTKIPNNVFYQVCTSKMEDTTLPANLRTYNNKYNEVKLYNFFELAVKMKDDTALGQAPAYLDLVMQDKSTKISEVSETHFGTNRYGTQYTVLYDLGKMQMHIVIGGDGKTQSYTYDLN